MGYNLTVQIKTERGVLSVHLLFAYIEMWFSVFLLKLKNLTQQP